MTIEQHQARHNAECDAVRKIFRDGPRRCDSCDGAYRLDGPFCPNCGRVDIRRMDFAPVNMGGFMGAIPVPDGKYALIGRTGDEYRRAIGYQR